MINKKIISYDEDSRETELLIESQDITLLVYAPEYFKDNNFKLIAFLPSNICISMQEPSVVKTKDSYYSQKIVGVLSKLKNGEGIISVHDINISVENIPKDIKVNSKIEFDCVRVDYTKSQEKEFIPTKI